MATIHIIRPHAQGLAQARRIALDWAQELQVKYQMECRYQKTKSRDALEFSGKGVSGTLHITAKQFELDVELSLLLSVFKTRIEAAIVKNLDLQLALALVPAKQ